MKKDGDRFDCNDLSLIENLSFPVSFDFLHGKGAGYFIKNIEFIKKSNEIVPINPTKEMLQAALGENYTEQQAFELKKMWRNMIHEHQKRVAGNFY